MGYITAPPAPSVNNLTFVTFNAAGIVIASNGIASLTKVTIGVYNYVFAVARGNNFYGVVGQCATNTVSVAAPMLGFFVTNFEKTNFGGVIRIFTSGHVPTDDAEVTVVFLG